MVNIRAAIDTSSLTSGHSVRGIGVHTRELVGQLTGKKWKGIKIESVDFTRSDLTRYDIVHYSYFHPHFLTLPFKKLAKMVVTIHDLIPLIYPKYYPPGLKGDLKFLVQKFLVRRADAIITISETSKKDIVRFLGVPEDKIHVVYLAPKKQFEQLKAGGWQEKIRKHYHLPSRFVLYVGDVNYNKNLNALARACKLAKVTLVIVGKQAVEENFNRAHPENQTLARLINKYGKDPGVIRLGFVPDEELVKLYNLATVYCQPSLYEGFGLPVLEAMACGCPTVAARSQSLVEIAEGAAIFVDPKVPANIASGLKKVMSNRSLQKDLISKGLEHVKKFSWDSVADETIKVYQKVVSQS